MAGGTLTFNSQYKSLAAEWLGLSPDRLAIKDEPDVGTKESKQEHVPASGKADKKKEKEQTIKVEQSFEIGEKLQRKLFKAKRKAYDREKDETARVHDKSVIGEEEESRSESVKKKPRLEEGKDGNRVKPLTITDLKTRLKDPTLSKPARKKLRKRLRVLEEKDGAALAHHDGQKHGFKGPIAEKLHAKLQRKEIDEFLKSFSDHMKDYNNKKKKRKNSISDKINKLKNTKQNQGNINTSDPTDQDDSDSDAEETESGNQSPGKVRKSDRSPVKKDNVQPSKKKTKKKTKSLHGGVTKDNRTDTTKHKKTTDGGSSKIGEDNNSKTTGRKRKRHKKRSKQKNIKNDHRPDEKKPAHLQGAGKNRVSQKLSSPQKNNSE
ncbi:myb-like protein X [Haliotis rubra]|uniref:myb-like protein X n=1 Tax=Haliotis rubra TaxID=36100 RepID=UPI001EE5EDEC|nr:myb-like protein X [Haliotis rubra]